MAKKKLLILEDDTSIHKLIDLTLATDFDLSFFSSIKEFKAQVDEFDGAILDINLPDGNGIDFCRQYLKPGTTFPIIFLTTESDLSPKLLAFAAGASDFLSKPFEPLELQARIKALMQLQGPESGPAQKISEHLEINQEQAKLLMAGKDLGLTLSEFRIFQFLQNKPGEFTSREELVAVLAEDGAIQPRTVDQHIYTLRKKLRETGAEINSKRKLGYSLIIHQSAKMLA